MTQQPDSDLTIDYLKQEIRDAFHGVRLGEGIGLWEGQAIDDYASDAERKKARDRDEKRQWQKLSATDLNDCYSSLSFFDADGMRFHLPAYMLLVIDGNENTGLMIYSLIRIDDFAISKLSTLNQTQRACISHFLRWCMRQPIYEHDTELIQEALTDYWDRR